MDPVRIRLALAILALAVLFYLLTWISFDRLPFTLLPTWWLGMWPSHSVGVYTWFGLLNGVGVVLAAVPVAILLRWLVDRKRVRAAFFVGVITALVVTGETVAEYSPFAHRATTLMTLEIFLVMVLAVPFLIWLLSVFPSNERMSKSRQS